MLETLPALAQHTGQQYPQVLPHLHSHRKTFNILLLPLVRVFGHLDPPCSSHPYLFQPHRPALLTFLPPTVDASPTPTVGRPFRPSHSPASGTENGKSVSMFPPSSGSAKTEAEADAGCVDEDDDDSDESQHCG
ncbi:hypothetical protein AX14_004818 [Amanita brunnescens Koide BX004]|nr:hypothetical protein AX14_004818 [Amanita brunnescens Koide BX004]